MSAPPPPPPGWDAPPPPPPGAAPPGALAPPPPGYKPQADPQIAKFADKKQKWLRMQRQRFGEKRRGGFV
ncbi:hypothetical protein KCU94_g20508, partial [Aureobasidium melanogenum]